MSDPARKKPRDAKPIPDRASRSGTPSGAKASGARAPGATPPLDLSQASLIPPGRGPDVALAVLAALGAGLGFAQMDAAGHFELNVGLLILGVAVSALVARQVRGPRQQNKPSAPADPPSSKEPSTREVSP